MLKKFLATGLILASAFTGSKDKFTWYKGAIVRGDVSKKIISLVFTGHEYAEGSAIITTILKEKNIKAAFFFTGDFYRNVHFYDLITHLQNDGHYLGAHSDKHLLYCDWSNRDSVLVGKDIFLKDLSDNYTIMKQFGIDKKSAKYFLPPYEWYNDTIASWAKNFGLQLINFTPGTRSHADYTTPEMENYQGSKKIIESILSYEENNEAGLNGFILLMHIGTHPQRTDKLYNSLDGLLNKLLIDDYSFVRIDTLLQ